VRVEMRLFGRSGNYAYACARVKARKKFLLSRETYSRLLVMDVHEIGRFLGETQYREEMAQAGSRYSGANLIEVAVTRNLAATYHSILGFTTGHLRDMVGNYLMRWDTFNVKTILRGKISDARDAEIIDTLVPAGAFSEEYLRSLVAMDSLQAIMEVLLKQPSLRISPEMMREVIDAGKLASMEDHLDTVSYYDLLDVVQPTNNADRLLRDFIRREIDVTNLKVLLKLKAGGIPAEKIQKYIITGGREYNADRLRTLAQGEGVGSVIEELEKSSEFDMLKPAVEKFKGDGSLSGLTIALDKALIGTSEKFANFYPLSVLPIINYMIRKKVEVDNIRIIARGKEGALPSQVIEELLVV
jgi:V/A-type H+-transporting ATPase subunit C